MLMVKMNNILCLPGLPLVHVMYHFEPVIRMGNN